MTAHLSVLHIASEAAPFVRTGGIADVCASLPRALARAGARVTLVIPRYRAIDPIRHSLARRLAPLEVPFAGRTETVTLYEGRLPGGHVGIVAGRAAAALWKRTVEFLSEGEEQRAS